MARIKEGTKVRITNCGHAGKHDGKSGHWSYHDGARPDLDYVTIPSFFGDDVCTKPIGVVTR